MSINNTKELQAHITNWIKSYALGCGRKDLVVISYEKTVSSKLLLKLCIATGMRVHDETDYGEFHSFSNFDCIKKSKEVKGLVLSPVTRDMMLTRHYRKYGDGAADLFPLADLYLSEIIEEHDETIHGEKQITHTELEWGDRENAMNGIIEKDPRPQSFKYWYKYSTRQKEIISRMHQLQKNTMHKKIMQPICKVRSTSWVM